MQAEQAKAFEAKEANTKAKVEAEAEKGRKAEQAAWGGGASNTSSNTSLRSASDTSTEIENQIDLFLDETDEPAEGAVLENRDSDDER